MFHPALRYRKINTYEDLVSLPFGKVGEYILMLSVFVVSFGATVEYLIMIKDMLPVLLGMENERNLVLVGMWVLFAVPLTFLKNLSSLAFVSGLSLLLSLYLIVVMIYQCPVNTSLASNGGLIPLLQAFWFRPNVFATISIFTEALAWQHGAFTVFNTLQNPTLRTWRAVTALVNAMAFILYVGIALPGFLGYLDHTDGDLFLNLPNNTFCNIARAFFSFIVIMTYPIEMLIARDVISSFIRRNDVKENRSKLLPDSSESKWCSKYFVGGKDLVAVMVLNKIALALGVYLTNLGVVLAFVGAIGGSIACFIMPGLVYLGVYGADFLELMQKYLGFPELVETSDQPQLVKTEKSCLAGNLVDPLCTACVPCKPWWFYVFGFPLWCRVASLGVKNISSKIGNPPCITEMIDEEKYKPNVTVQVLSSDDTVHPSWCRFLSAIFLIVFGSIVMVMPMF